MRNLRAIRCVLIVLVGVASAMCLPAVAHANWLTKILTETAEVGGKGAARVGRSALARAAHQLKRLPPEPGRALFAATVSGEGHWTFVNRAGQAFTAANAAELKRVVQVLSPEHAAGAPFSVVVADDVLFRHRAVFKDLPEGASVRLAARGESFRVRGDVRKLDAPLFLEVRPNVQLRMSSPIAMEEGLWQLARPFNAKGVRVLALDAKGPDTLPSLPRVDPKSKRVLADRVDPGKLARAMSALRGQTVVISARIEGGGIVFRGAGGGERVVALKDIVAAAERWDVNLVLLNARVPRQPGDLNWLWQRVTIDGLEDALGRSSRGAFLSALVGDSGHMVVEVAERGSQRAVLLARAVPGAMALPNDGQLGRIVAEVASEVAGTVVAHGIRMDLVSRHRRKELDERIVPGIPADLQFFIIGLWTMALISFSVVSGWWARLWPPEDRTEYGSWFGFASARIVRMALFVFVFMPVVGLPALVWLVLSTIVRWLMLPFRLLGLGSRRTDPPAAAQ